MKKNRKNFKIVLFFLFTLITVLFFPFEQINATTYTCKSSCEGGKQSLVREMCEDSACDEAEDALKCCAFLTLNITYPEAGGININTDQNINEIIAWGYYFIIGVSGFAAFFKFVYAGFLWTSSRGDPSKIKEAQDEIYAASVGLLLILSTYLILPVINPELTTLKLPDIN